MSAAPSVSPHSSHKVSPLWSLCVVSALLIPWVWELLQLPPSLGHVLQLHPLDWMSLPWLTSATLLVLGAGTHGCRPLVVHAGSDDR